MLNTAPDVQPDMSQSISPETLAENATLISQIEHALATFNSTALDADAIEQSMETVEAALTENIQVLSGYQSELTAIQAECVEQLDQFQQGLDTSQDSLNQAATATRQSLEALEDAVENEASQIKSTMSGLSSKLDELIELATTVDSGLSEAATELSTHFESLDDGIADIKQQAETLESETLTRLSELSSDFEESLPAVVDPMIEQFVQQLSQDQKDALRGGFTDFEGQLSGLLEQFNQEFETIGNELEESGSEILTSVSDHFKETLRQEIEDTFSEIVSNVLSEVMEEVTENIVLTQVGQSTTAALGTALPFIAAAKVATGVLSALDDVF